MNEDDVKRIATEVYNQMAQSAQYGVARVPFHTHNGIDSSQLPFIGLYDVPVTYDGHAGDVPTVNSDETALVFTSSSGSPGGANTDVQFNDNGSFGGSSEFTYDSTSGSLTVGEVGDPSGISIEPGGQGVVFRNDESTPLVIATFYGSGVYGLNTAGSWLVSQHTVPTTNATPTTIAVVQLPTDGASFVEVRVAGYRTGGTSGSTGDSGLYVRRAGFKCIASTATLLGATQDSFTVESQGGWDVTIIASGGSAVVQVTGAANNNITWDCVVLRLNNPSTF